MLSRSANKGSRKGKWTEKEQRYDGQWTQDSPKEELRTKKSKKMDNGWSSSDFEGRTYGYRKDALGSPYTVIRKENYEQHKVHPKKRCRVGDRQNIWRRKGLGVGGQIKRNGTQEESRTTK